MKWEDPRQFLLYAGCRHWFGFCALHSIWGKGLWGLLPGITGWRWVRRRWAETILVELCWIFCRAHCQYHEMSLKSSLAWFKTECNSLALLRLLLYKTYKSSMGRLILCDYLFKKWIAAQQSSHLILTSSQSGEVCGKGCLFVQNEEWKDHIGDTTWPGTQR